MGLRMFPFCRPDQSPCDCPQFGNLVGWWPVKAKSARISSEMRLDIYCFCSNNRNSRRPESQSPRPEYSNPPSKASANSKATDAQLEDSSPLLVLFQIGSSFSGAEIVFPCYYEFPRSTCRCVSQMSNWFSKAIPSSKTAFSFPLHVAFIKN